MANSPFCPHHGRESLAQLRCFVQSQAMAAFSLTRSKQYTGTLHPQNNGMAYSVSEGKKLTCMRDTHAQTVINASS